MRPPPVGPGTYTLARWTRLLSRASARWPSGARASVERVIVGKRDDDRAARWSRCCARATSCSRTCPASARPCWPRRSRARSAARFRRIQFTPDLLPTDVTGVSIFNQRRPEFEFRAGPIFAQVVLADEINRATPRTQSALLEAMEERQVTVDGETRPLPPPVPGPGDAEPDRATRAPSRCPRPSSTASCCGVGSATPTLDEERRSCVASSAASPLDELVPVGLGRRAESSLQRRVADVHVEDAVRGLRRSRIVRATRDHGDVELGASPRGDAGAVPRGARRWPRSAAATSCCRTTSSGSPRSS